MTDNNVFNQSGRKLETMSKELGFDIPTDLIPLPSKGAIYSVDHAFHNLEEVEIRTMSAKDEDLLTSKALIKKGTVITELLKSCLLNKAVDVDSLLVGDRNALLIAIRVSGYGAEYSVKIDCPDCGESFDNDFSLAKLPIKRLGAEPVSLGVNQFSFKLPLSGLDIQFKLLTGNDDLLIGQEAEKKKKLGLSQTENLVTRKLFYSIVSVGGEMGRDKIARIVQNLRAGDSLALRRYIESIEPGVDMRQEATCKHCGVSSEVDVPIGASFFWPDIR